MEKRLHCISSKKNANFLYTKDAEEETKSIIKDLYIKHNIELPLNPIFREITQPRPGAGFYLVVDRDKYKIYSKIVHGNTYIKLYVAPNW